MFELFTNTSKNPVFVIDRVIIALFFPVKKKSKLNLHQDGRVKLVLSFSPFSDMKVYDGQI